MSYASFEQVFFYQSTSLNVTCNGSIRHCQTNEDNSNTEHVDPENKMNGLKHESTFFLSFLLSV